MELPSKVVSEQLGHSNSYFTMDVYTHTSPSLNAAAAKKFSDLLFGEQVEKPPPDPDEDPDLPAA